MIRKSFLRHRPAVDSMAVLAATEVPQALILRKCRQMHLSIHLPRLHRHQLPAQPQAVNVTAMDNFPSTMSTARVEVF